MDGVRMSADRVFWACAALLALSSCALAQSPASGAVTPAANNGTNATTAIAVTTPAANSTANASTTAIANNTAAPTVPTTNTTANTSPTAKPASTAVTVPATANTSSTTVISKTTAATALSTASVPVTSSMSAAPQKISGFDLGSFIGGIVLTLGILAVLYFGCRFYNSKRGVRYRTIDEHEAII